MAYLSDNDRAELTAKYQSDPELSTETFGAMTKADLRAAFNAIDAYLEDNKATINTAIPQPARGAMTTKQKARLLIYVVEKRYLTGN